MTMTNRFYIFAGGISGAAGVALSAAAAHIGGGTVETAAHFLLAHAPAFLALGFLARTKVLTAGAWLLLVGVLVFSGDLLMRNFAGTRLFPMAAPTGGTVMILGWLVIATGAFFSRTEG
jgi:uncharacterized membrane protein YgdD (TMEM256/DUF423 family)